MGDDNGWQMEEITVMDLPVGVPVCIEEMTITRRKDVPDAISCRVLVPWPDGVSARTCRLVAQCNQE